MRERSLNANGRFNYNNLIEIVGMDMAVVSLRICLVSVQRDKNDVSHSLSWAMTAFNKWLNIQTVSLYEKRFRVLNAECTLDTWLESDHFWEEKQTSGLEGHLHPGLGLELKCWDSAANFSVTTALLPVMEQTEVPFNLYYCLFIFMNVSEFISERGVCTACLNLPGVSGVAVRRGIDM